MSPARVGCGEPHLIVEEDNGDNCCHDHHQSSSISRSSSSSPQFTPAVTGLVKPVAVRRPVALKVARPIPQRATEQFYNEAYRQGIPAYAVNAAIMESHDWHRKWTQQDEEGHTMPHDHLNNSNNLTGAVPQQYAYQAPTTTTTPTPEAESDRMVLDRMAGARNPSPEWESVGDEQERKRGRHLEEEVDDECDQLMGQPQQQEQQQQQGLVRPVAQHQHQQQLPQVPVQILWDNENSRNTTPSSLNEGSAESDDEEEDYMVHVAKRPVPVRPPAPAVESDEEDDDIMPLNANPVVRPVALRVPRPVIAKLPTSSSGALHLIPDYISATAAGADQGDESSCSKMSAITQASGLSNKSGNNNGFDFHQTNLREVQPLHLIEDECDSKNNLSYEESLVTRRDSLLQALAVSGGDAQADKFVSTIQPLAELFDGQDLDTRACSSDSTTKSVHGTWLTLTKPTFFGNLGENDNGDPMYTLGRMTFDMFSPTNLVCSLQGNFNCIEVVGDEDRKAMLEAGLVPKTLREEVENRDVVLRTYNVVTAFTIESSLADYPDAPNKDVRRPIRGIMTTYGYTLPDPEIPNRHSIWITGGRIEPNNDVNDIREWKRLFSLHPPKHGLGEQAKLLAVKLLMGASIPDKMNDDGSMEYNFSRPLGGHGVAYVDVLYLDKSLRVVRGHRGTYFVFSRLPQEVEGMTL